STARAPLHTAPPGRRASSPSAARSYSLASRSHEPKSSSPTTPTPTPSRSSHLHTRISATSPQHSLTRARRPRPPFKWRRSLPSPPSQLPPTSPGGDRGSRGGLGGPPAGEDLRRIFQDC